MKQEIILIGGGGHCAACIDVIELEGKYSIAGIVDNNLANEKLLNYPVLGNDEDLPLLRKKINFALITVGQIESPLTRKRIYEKLTGLGFILPSIISPRSYISKHASVGEGTIIMHDVLVNSRASIGNNCIINSKALVEHDAKVGDQCHISTGVIINGGTVVNNGSFVGSNAVTKEYAKTRENDFIKAGSTFKGYINE